MTDIGHITIGILLNVMDLHELWRRPDWRDDFGKRELEDIEQAKDRLAELEQFILVYQNRKMRGVA